MPVLKPLDTGFRSLVPAVRLEAGPILNFGCWTLARIASPKIRTLHTTSKYPSDVGCLSRFAKALLVLANIQNLTSNIRL